MNLQALNDAFTRTFGEGEPAKLFHAPGRVNLIGEHTDYNGGYVFPCALSLGTYGAARKRNDGIVKLVSANMEPAVSFPIAALVKDPSHGWANYPKSVVWQLQGAGYTLGGFEMYIHGDLPNSAGLSSSASVSLLTAVVLNTLFDLQIDPVERVKHCLRAENQFIGVNCGIMDQFAVGMGQKERAILLNCGTLDYTLVPLYLGDYRIVLANTNVRRGLADSKYNERRAECDRALADLQKVCEVKELCDLTPEQFEVHKSAVTDETAQKRATHAVYENARTMAASEALRRGDLVSFGKMMNESHKSLRDLYDVTGAELDALVESAWAMEGVLGSRMTGAGFGGCTVSMVAVNALEAFTETVGSAYTTRTGLKADFYLAETGDGARELYA